MDASMNGTLWCLVHGPSMFQWNNTCKASGTRCVPQPQVPSRLLFDLKQHHKWFQKGRHKENIFLEPNVAKKTIVNLGFPFLWGLFLYSECEMAIFPVSVMRKWKYYLSSLPRCFCCTGASPQVPVSQRLLTELWLDAYGEESGFCEIC